ncbi:unnamed protein product [Hermetia illucens]|uniref:Bardet-Biedl syndrome 1 N-terminal domain-containing protein n=1 Tax=Hermetia illucens TaxID=343691 RepID=A0A7R8YS91_HERIL|nr:unnamed protein product [Hermetia illucens]
MTLCDLKNDDYHKLVLAEIPEDKTKTKSKLKVFKGIGMVSEHSLPGIPTSLVSFYTEEATPKTPIIAASIGPDVLFYRNMKPYFKYTLPSLPINPLEIDIWRKLPIQVPENQGALITELGTIPFEELTPQSQKLLGISESERDVSIIYILNSSENNLPWLLLSLEIIK